MSHSPWWTAPGESLAFTVTAQDDWSPAQGQTVTSSVSRKDGAASLDTDNTTTGRNGQTATTWTLGSDASDSYTVTPWGGTKSTSGTATDETTPPPPPPSDYYPWVISHLGSGAPGDTLTLIVEVRGEDENPVPGQTVTFSILSGDGNAWLSTTSATTGNNGRAQTTLTLGNSASGSYNVKASISNHLFATSYTTVQTSPPPPPPPELSISVVSGPGSGAPGDTLTLIVEVQEDGSSASGKTVTFSITSGDGNASLGTTSTTTGSNGRAQTTLTLGNSASGSYTITATVGSQSTSGSATVNTPSPPPPPPPELSISVVSGPGSGAPGDTLTFIVKVQEDESSASGKAVTFSITSGDGNASLGTTSTTTGSNGRAQTTLTLGNSASGSYTITATVGSQSTSGTATVITPAPPLRSLVMSHSPWPIDPGESITFAVTVKEGESAAPGKTVTFSVSPDDGTVSLNPTSTTTGSNGQAQTTLTTGSGSSGSYTVTASVGDSSVSGTATVNTLPLPPPELSISVVSGPGSGEPGDALTFTVEVQEDGSAASGKTVTFSITSGDGNVSLNPTSATTGSNGQASTTLTLGNSASGSYTITATVGSKSTSGTATVNTSPPPELSISVVSGPGSGASGDTLTFIVEVQEDGSAASGKTVTFSITSGDGNASLNPTSATTGSNGQASTTLTLGNSASGSYTITATVGSQSTSGTATVITPSPPMRSLVMSHSPWPINPGESITFTVTVKEGESAAPGKTVTFSVSPDDGTVSLNTASETTNSNGQAQTTLTTGSGSSGSYTVTASVGDSSVSGTATVETSPPLTGLAISVVSGPGSGEPGDTLTFIVEVQEDGSAASGKTVAFSITSGDGNSSLGTTSATTGSNGRAQTTLTLGNSASGSYTITAMVGSKSTSGTATVETTPPPPPPSDYYPWVISQLGSGAPGDTLTLIVEVRGEDENPVPGQTVTFSIASGDGNASLSTTSATTGSNGRAQTTLTLGNSASGSYNVKVTISNHLFATSVATVETSPSPELSISVVSDPGSGEPGDTLTFIVEVQEDGSAASGKTVAFSITSGDGNASLSTTSATTGSNGRAQTMLTLGNSASGPYTVTASVGDSTVSGTATVETSPPPTGLAISVVSGPGSGEPGDTLTFIVEVQEDGSAASGKTVAFSITSGDGNASLGTTSTTTGSNGRAQTTLTLGNSASGSYTITATVGSKSTSGTATVNTPSPPLRSLVMSHSPWPIDPGESMTFTVTVKEGESAALGKTVTFSVSPDDGTVSLNAASATTDSNGQAQTTLTTGSGSSGSYTVTASVGTSSLSSTVTVETSTSEQQQQEDSSDDGSSDDDLPPPPMPTALAILLDDYQTGLTGKALVNPFVVEVRDQNGNPLEGVPVAFAVTAGEGSLSTTTAMTDAYGLAQSTLTLGNEPGTNTVKAIAEGLPQTAAFNAEASLPPPEATFLSIVSGDNQTGFTSEALVSAFVVEVRNQYDDPMDGIAVTFAVTAGGGSLSSEMVMTDANGQAESTLTLGSDPGTNSVEVSVEGISRSEVFSAEASLPPPVATSLSIVSGDNQEAVIGEVLTNSFVVEVRDQYDNPMAGVTVTFAVSEGGSSLSATTGMTDANGRAESTLTLGSDPGANTVEVSVEGITEATIFNAIAELLEFDLSVPSGISFVHVPLKIASVDGRAQALESVGDLYDALGGAATVKLLITYNRDTLQWNSYLGDESRGDLEDRVLTDSLGIIASMKTPVSVRLGGKALGMDGMSIISLNRGMNLVGLPLKDLRIMRVSDLLALEGLAGVVSTIIVSDDRRFKTVGQADDDGDIHVTGGDAFLLIATEAATIDISGEGWTNSPVMLAAPPMTLAGVEAGDTTPVLVLTGSISTDGTGLNKTGVHVTVKNLTTGKSVTTAMLNRGYRDLDYQATTVDMGTGQAARIGDVLEISAQSAELSIRFDPVRHIVTSDDVERSRIHLPELIAHEIPAKTELLSNYPNPFNPETWIPYGLANDTNVQISIYDISGALVRQLNLGHQRAGNYTQRSRAAYWDGSNGIGEHVASGVYFYTLTAGHFTATRKMLVGK